MSRLKQSIGLIVLCLLLVACGPAPSSELLPADSNNKIRFVNYWAEWCKPCREEIPALNKFQRQQFEHVQVYGVNFDGVSGDALAQLEGALGIEFPNLSNNPLQQLSMAPPRGLPFTLVFDGDGELITQLEGEQTVASLNALLAVIKAGGGESTHE